MHNIIVITKAIPSKINLTLAAYFLLYFNLIVIFSISLFINNCPIINDIITEASGKTNRIAILIKAKITPYIFCDMLIVGVDVESVKPYTLKNNILPVVN